MAGHESLTLTIGGMTCASCVRRVERVLAKVEGVDTASVNLASETARVTLSSPVEVEVLTAAVSKAGYRATEADPNADRTEEKAAEARRTRLALAFGALFAVPAIIVSMGMDIAAVELFGSRTLTGWLALGLATPVQIVLGWRFYRGGVTSLIHFNPNMDVLVALGTTVAYVYSAWTVISGSHAQMYFDVSTAVLVFITMGKYFEESAKGRASSAIRALLGLAAKSATVIRDGAEIEVPVSDVHPGDLVAVRPGQRVPVDGRILEGHATVDESMLTGESIPVEREEGAALIGGTIVQDGFVRVEATAVGKDAALAQMAALVEEAQGSKAPVPAPGRPRGRDLRTRRHRLRRSRVSRMGEPGRRLAGRNGRGSRRPRCCLSLRARACDTDRDHGRDGDGRRTRDPDPKCRDPRTLPCPHRSRGRQDWDDHGGATRPERGHPPGKLEQRRDPRARCRRGSGQRPSAQPGRHRLRR